MSKYWQDFYKKVKEMPPSTFAVFAAPYISGHMVDLGCGNGRDLYFFLKNEFPAIGVDESFKSEEIIKMDVSKFMKKHPSPETVYTRFFWHSIDRKTQIQIMDWAKDYLLIEARTTEDENMDKIYKHKRNYVDVPQLVKDLKNRGFQILLLQEGHFSPYQGENPHLVRVVAKKLEQSSFVI